MAELCISICIFLSYKTLTIRICNLNYGLQIRILDPKIWGNLGGFRIRIADPIKFITSLLFTFNLTFKGAFEAVEKKYLKDFLFIVYTDKVIKAKSL